MKFDINTFAQSYMLDKEKKAILVWADKKGRELAKMFEDLPTFVHWYNMGGRRKLQDLYDTTKISFEIREYDD